MLEMQQISGLELLEYIQRENAAKHKVPNSLDRFNELKAAGDISNEWYERFQNECKNAALPNKYQDVAQYVTLKKHFDDIWRVILGSSEAIATPNMTPINGPPIFGTIPMNKFAARVTKHTLSDKTLLTSSEDVVLISNELLNFARNFGALVAEMIPVVGNTQDRIDKQNLEVILDKNKIIKKAKNNKILKRNFCLMILEYFMAVDDNRNHNLFAFTTKNELLASDLTNSFISFILSHEFAHIVCGHTEISEKQKTEEGKISEEWIVELQADLVAFNWALEVTREHTNIQLGAIGIFLCFDSFIIFDRLENLKLDSSNDFIDFKSTHPPGIMRRMQLMDPLEHTGPSLVTECANAINHIIINIYLSEFEKIFEDCKKRFRGEFTLGDILNYVVEYFKQ